MGFFKANCIENKVIFYQGWQQNIILEHDFTDPEYQYQCEIKKAELCNVRGVKFVWKISSTGIGPKFFPKRQR